MLTILLNNQFSIPIISANATSTREKFVNTMNISLAFLDTTTQDDIYNIATMINDQNSVICVYIDNVRYFTGFVEEAQINESRNETTEEITISLKLQSKTIDLLQSTYIPPIFDKVNGGSNFFTNGQINFLNIIRVTLQKLGWVIVDSQGPDSDKRFTEYNIIGIINKTDNAKKQIILDNKKGTATVERLFVDGAMANTTIKSLKPSATESAGVFLMRLANELGLILTTNADGDIVIEDASATITPPLWQNFTKKIVGDAKYNNILSLDITKNYTQIYNKYYRVVNDADDQNTPEKSFVGSKRLPKASINDNARNTRHYAYSAGETVNVRQQITSQEMMAKTMFARSYDLSITPISHRYTTTNDLQPNPQEKKLIEAGDLVFVYIESLGLNEIIDNELMYISEVSIKYAKSNIGLSVKLVLPDYYSNPSIRPRKQLIRQRKLSST